MLKSIYIKDFAIIDELRIDFEDGFNVFTGETGAGKSIIVGALNFLNGNRADISYIRKGSKKAIIEGIFSLNEEIKETLDKYEIEYEDELIIYRTLSIDSKNTIRINNRSVSLAILKDILKDSIDIHSQKDSQYLLNPNNHLNLVDTFMHNEKLLNEVKDAYLKYKHLNDEYHDFLNNNDSNVDIDYYRYQIKEIEEANLDVNEEIELEDISKKAKNSKKYFEHLSKALNHFNDNDGINDRLYEAIKELDYIDYIDDIKDGLKEKYYEIEEYFESLSHLLDEINISEDEINRVEERLFNINRLKRKYHGEIKDILILKDELINKVNAFDNSKEYLEDYQRSINKALEVYNELDDKLYQERLKASKKLSKYVIEETKDLELKYFDFKIDFIKNNPSSKGSYSALFMISTNKGEDLKALNKVASGGEMSRVLLALKAIFTKLSNTTLVIFDEIDTGVSGKAASAIGLKMAKIAKDTQVLSITHLAQVASFADNQYYVKKEQIDDRTTSSISLLNDDERIKELAMMSLSSMSDNALEVTKELLNNSLKLKNEL